MAELRPMERLILAQAPKEDMARRIADESVRPDVQCYYFGCIESAGHYWLDFGGNCPVQGFGEVDGHFCHFRARGTGWRLEIFARDSGVNENIYVETDVQPIFVRGEHCYNWPDAGWISDEQVMSHFTDAVRRFRAGEPSHDPGKSRRQLYDTFRRVGIEPMRALGMVYRPWVLGVHPRRPGLVGGF